MFVNTRLRRKLSSSNVTVTSANQTIRGLLGSLYPQNVTITSANQDDWYHVEGSGNEHYRGGSWKKYHEERSGKKWPAECCICGCTDKATDGAHVEKRDGSYRGEKFIAPICDSHNRAKNTVTPVTLNVGTILVPIDYSDVYFDP